MYMLPSYFALGVWCCFFSASSARSVEQRLAHSRDLIKGLKLSEIALLQFDSRELDNYWLTSAIYNDYYAKKHGHQFLYYSLTKGYLLHLSVFSSRIYILFTWFVIFSTYTVLTVSFDYRKVSVYLKLW